MYSSTNVTVVTFLARAPRDREYAQSMPRNHVRPVLVGREGELAALIAAFGAAAAAEPGVVLVGGEAGVGKTRRVQEAADRDRLAGARGRRRRCVALGGEGLPF